MESNKVAEQLQEYFQSIGNNRKVLTVSPDELIPLMYRLRDEYEFNYLTDETAVDYGDYFEVIYNLSRVPQGDILMVKTKVDKEKAEVPSVFEVWPGAIWFEREIFDLLGIKFTNHPDLRRILLDDSFEGHPLRKDFQWVGGREV